MVFQLFSCVNYCAKTMWKFQCEEMFGELFLTIAFTIIIVWNELDFENVY